MTLRPTLVACAAGAMLGLPVSLVAATGDAAAPPAYPRAASGAAPALPSTTASTHAADHERAPADPVGPCESRVTDSIREMRKGAREVQFTSDAQVVKPGGMQVEVKGDGKYLKPGAPAVAFRYTCTFDESARKATGVVLHEAENGPPPALAVWKADPLLVLPEACESAMASTLRAANPRAGSIVFDSMDRHLDPIPGGGTALSGQGTIVRGPGLPAGPFRYRCDYDATGRVTQAQQVG